MSTMSVQQAIELAMKEHIAGRLGAAESIYRQILQAHPGQPDSLHLLGVLELQRGKFDTAIELITRAIKQQPRDARFHCNLGQALAAQGKTEQAIQAYRKALALSPELPEAHNNIGNALQDQGKINEAAEAYRQALKARANFPEALNNLGNTLRQTGQIQEAIDCYRQALALRPNFADALCNLGASLIEIGNFDEAITSLRQAISHRDDAPDYHNNLSNALRQKGDITGAIESARKALSIRPDFSRAHNNLGVALLADGQLDQATSAFQQAVAVEPGFAEAYLNLANAQRFKGQSDKAIESYRQAISIQPQSTDAHASLGMMLHSLDRFEEAIESFQRAVALKPDNAAAIADLGTSLIQLGRLSDGIDCYRQSIAYRPENAIVHYNLGMTLMLAGDFRNGWSEMEWRWYAPETGLRPPMFAAPRWDGMDLNGKRIMLFAEQGFSDALQFARFIPEVAKRGGKVIFACFDELAGLMKSVEGVDQVVTLAEQLPEHDVYFPLLSLPIIFDTTIDSVPASVPYLKADADKIAKWNVKLSAPAQNAKIGIAWLTNANDASARQRSVPLTNFAPLLKQSGVSWFSLQSNFGSVRAELQEFPQVAELSDELTSLDEIAAAIENLDLVITADSTIAHLAGALGKPVFVVLSTLPDYRWMLGRNDSPWYPTAKLFRQPARGDWKTPIDQLSQELSSWLAKRA